jgi:hypothetical protein
MHLNNLSQLPVLTREKRMIGIATLEDIAREQKALPDLRHYNLSIICRTSSTFLASFEAVPSIHLIYLQKTSRSAV